MVDCIIILFQKIVKDIRIQNLVSLNQRKSCSLTAMKTAYIDKNYAALNKENKYAKLEIKAKE